MVADPLSAVEEYVAAGAGVVTFHVEATHHPHRVLQSLAGRGVVRGVALNPGTPVETRRAAARRRSSSCCSWRSTRAGRGSRRSGRRRTASSGCGRSIGSRPVAVGIDGGVTRANIGRIAALEPDMIVAGSAVFSGNGAAASGSRDARRDRPRERRRKGREPWLTSNGCCSSATSRSRFATARSPTRTCGARPAADPVPAIMVRTPYTKEVEEINVFSEPRVAACARLCDRLAGRARARRVRGRVRPVLPGGRSTGTTRSSTSPASTGARATSSWPGTRTWARPSGWPQSRRRPACARSRPGSRPTPTTRAGRSTPACSSSPSSTPGSPASSARRTGCGSTTSSAPTAPATS